MTLELAVPNVKGCIVNEKTDEFAVSDIDNRLPRLGVSVSSLRIGQRA